MRSWSPLGGKPFQQFEHGGAALGGEAVEVVLVGVGEQGIAYGVEGELDLFGLVVEESQGFAR